MSKVLTIRADCSPTMGTGHVMRMIALGQAWQALGGTVRFVGQTTPLERRLRKEGFDLVPLDRIHPAPEDAQTLLNETDENAWVSIDGYHFDTAYQKTIRNAKRRTLVLDDFFDRGEYHADILLNQNPDGPRSPYSLDGGALLLGTKYTLLRTEFQRRKKTKKIQEKAANLLVTLGGADPDNVTSRVVKAIAATGLTTLNVTVVAGAANRHLETIRTHIESLPCTCELLTDVADMPALMAETDLAISAGGTTSWELCYFGVPFIAIEIADNQQGIIRELKRHKAAYCLDRETSVRDIATALEILINDPNARQAMHEAGSRLVDGKGAMRTAQMMYNADINIRLAHAKDCEVLHAWRNAPETRASSFSTEEIPLETHCAWFQDKLKDAGCLFFIAIEKDKPIGQIRFDREGDKAVVSISVDPAIKNRGIGTIMTRLGCLAMQDQWPGVTATALVKQDNPASAAMFAKAGFSEPQSPDDDYLTLVWSGNNHDA